MAQNGPERADSSRVIGFFLDFVSSGNGSIDEASRAAHVTNAALHIKLHCVAQK
jgi:hypothetical protein